MIGADRRVNLKMSQQKLPKQKKQNGKNRITK